jgi:hypothetical protein
MEQPDLPRCCYILSLQCNGTTNVDGSLLIHRVAGDVTLGVVAMKVDPALNSPFFIALVECYFGDKAVTNFAGIQLGRKIEKFDSFIIQGGKTAFFNHCPKSQETATLMDRAIYILRSLLLFISCSLLVRYEQPSLVVKMRFTSV